MKKRSDLGSELGRSMIEMLGVLAIVGILSIGGISAFQKAMNKHKINQVTEELSGFINELLRYSADWRREISGDYREITSLVDFLVPATWERKGNYIKDSAGNKIIVAVRTDYEPARKKISLSYRFIERDAKSKTDLCMALYEMTKTFADSIWGATPWHRAGDNSATPWAYGNAFCGGRKKCLRDLTFSEMRANCEIFEADDDDCSFAIHFPI